MGEVVGRMIDLPNGADLQVDDGNYTRIHYSILEVLAVARLSTGEYRAILFLLRKTYGFNKKDDEISLSQWAEGTNTSKGNISNVLDTLVTKNVVYRKPGSKKAHYIYGFNKYVETWDKSIFEKVQSQSKRANKRYATAEQLCPGIKEVMPRHKESLCPGSTTIDNIDTLKDIPAPARKNGRTKPKKAERTPEEVERTEQQKAIMSAYGKALGYAIANYGQENAGAATLVKAGYSAEQVVWCYLLMKGEPFWRDKHLSLQKVAGQIGAKIAAFKPAQPAVDDDPQMSEYALWREEREQA